MGGGTNKNKEYHKMSSFYHALSLYINLLSHGLFMYQPCISTLDLHVHVLNIKMTIHNSIEGAPSGDYEVYLTLTFKHKINLNLVNTQSHE